jgi:hypothetical protein
MQHSQELLPPHAARLPALLGQHPPQAVATICHHLAALTRLPSAAAACPGPAPSSVVLLSRPWAAALQLLRAVVLHGSSGSEASGTAGRHASHAAPHHITSRDIHHITPPSCCIRSFMAKGPRAIAGGPHPWINREFHVQQECCCRRSAAPTPGRATSMYHAQHQACRSTHLVTRCWEARAGRASRAGRRMPGGPHLAAAVQAVQKCDTGST